ncbi:MAG: transposase [Acidobacteria bacterium]|nr:transposase [Acidobacteriota bacterium]MCI0717384.1 transposase [Acidobacteriota bacterium]
MLVEAKAVTSHAISGTPALGYLQNWIRTTLAARPKPFNRLARLLIKHLDGIPSSGAGIAIATLLLLKVQRQAVSAAEQGPNSRKVG